MNSPGSVLRRFIGAMFVALLAFGATASPANAMYGVISGLFVTTSPAALGLADFSGLGCDGGHEVVLYFPDLEPTANDPVASQSVPGRILAVTTSATSPNLALNGTFSFPNVRLPTDIEPGTYAVHARCGEIDLSVFLQISSDGRVTLTVDPLAPTSNGTIDSEISSVLPFTGSDSNRFVSLASGLIAAGLAFLALSRRSSRVRA